MPLKYGVSPFAEPAAELIGGIESVHNLRLRGNRLNRNYVDEAGSAWIVRPRRVERGFLQVMLAQAEPTERIGSSRFGTTIDIVTSVSKEPRKFHPLKDPYHFNVVARSVTLDLDKSAAESDKPDLTIGEQPVPAQINGLVVPINPVISEVTHPEFMTDWSPMLLGIVQASTDAHL